MAVNVYNTSAAGFTAVSDICDNDRSTFSDEAVDCNKIYTTIIMIIIIATKVPIIITAASS